MRSWYDGSPDRSIRSAEGVGQHADHAVEFRAVPAGDREADHQVLGARQPAHERGVGGEHRHERRTAARPGRRGDPLADPGRQREPLGAARRRTDRRRAAGPAAERPFRGRPAAARPSRRPSRRTRRSPAAPAARPRSPGTGGRVRAACGAGPWSRSRSRPTARAAARPATSRRRPGGARRAGCGGCRRRRRTACSAAAGPPPRRRGGRPRRAAGVDLGHGHIALHARLGAPCGGHHLQRHPVGPGAEDRAQRLVPGDEGVQGAPEGGQVEGPAHDEGGRHVVLRAACVHVVQDEQPGLRVRGRELVLVVFPGPRAGGVRGFSLCVQRFAPPVCGSVSLVASRSGPPARRPPRSVPPGAV